MFSRRPSATEQAREMFRRIRCERRTSGLLWVSTSSGDANWHTSVLCFSITAKEKQNRFTLDVISWVVIWSINKSINGDAGTKVRGRSRRMTAELTLCVSRIIIVSKVISGLAFRTLFRAWRFCRLMWSSIDKTDRQVNYFNCRASRHDYQWRMSGGVKKSGTRHNCRRRFTMNATLTIVGSLNEHRRSAIQGIIWCGAKI